MRQLSGTRALLAGLVGLGYVYVGRISTAITLLLGTVALIAALSWTRLILNAWAGYLVLAIYPTVLLLQLVHPVLIALNEKQAVTKPYSRWWFYTLWVLGVTISMNLLAANRAALFGYGIFRIPATSMAPTLEPGDVIIVDSWRYLEHDPAVSEVIVFRSTTGVDYVKRIVGIPGDRISIREGIVYRNESPLVETYLHAPTEDWPYGRDIAPIELGKSDYYVLGDFRGNSKDSRIFGPISSQQIRGRVEYIGFSFSTAGIRWARFPSYFEYDP